MSDQTEEVRQRLDAVLEEYLALDDWLRQMQNSHFRVCIFGSARIKPTAEAYHLVLHLARDLAMDGVDIVTGGGPGLMEAANRGVREAQTDLSRSYGVTIELPRIAEVPNKHLDIKSSHKRFSSRLDEFMRLTHAVIVAPGGIGTLLEMMYVWQLLQVGLIEGRPVVLLDRYHWGGLIDWICEKIVDGGFASAEDMAHVHTVDTPEEALTIIRESHRRFQEELAATDVSGAVPPPLPLAGGRVSPAGVPKLPSAKGAPEPRGAPPAPRLRR